MGERGAAVRYKTELLISTLKCPHPSAGAAPWRATRRLRARVEAEPTVLVTSGAAAAEAAWRGRGERSCASVAPAHSPLRESAPRGAPRRAAPAVEGRASPRRARPGSSTAFAARARSPAGTFPARRRQAAQAQSFLPPAYTARSRRRTEARAARSCTRLFFPAHQPSCARSACAAGRTGRPALGARGAPSPRRSRRAAARRARRRAPSAAALGAGRQPARGLGRARGGRDALGGPAVGGAEHERAFACGAASAALGRERVDAAARARKCSRPSPGLAAAARRRRRHRLRRGG